MSLRLKMATLLAPRSFMKKELGRVADMTTTVLDELVDDYAPDRLEALRSDDVPLKGSLEERRMLMAHAQSRRVQALVDELGEEEAIRHGRRRMGPIGERLGAEARLRFSVDDSMDDLLMAAELLYRVLGIEFEAEEAEDGSVTLVIDRCGLSGGYDGITCRLMSAADEGMIRGLNPRAQLEFRDRMTEASQHCTARIELQGRPGR
jgi:hypothetical protein